MIEIACGILLTIGLYLILDNTLIRRLFGIALMSTSINIIILLCGRVQMTTPAFLNGVDTKLLSNPLPQALILTAIVIGFGLLIMLGVIIYTIMNSEKGPFL